MEARTFLLWFKMDPNLVKERIDDALSKIETLPAQFMPGQWTRSYNELVQTGCHVMMFTNVDGSHAVLRLLTSGLLTFDLQTHTAETTNKNRPKLMSMIREGMDRMKQQLGIYCLYAKCLDCPIFRGYNPPWPYHVTGDQRLVQLDFTELVYETTSEWQNIKIYKSQQCGNVLYLDDDVMIGESDLVYTESVLGLDRNDFDGKSVLILGGGDGGIIHELITRTKPSFVTMVEIDEEVIKACRTHMRSVCGSTMDQYDGSNYKIVIGDCMKHLQQAVDNNQHYDYIVNDLTEYPANKECFDYDYVMTYKILDYTMQCLSPTGKYLARGNTISAPEYISGVEREMERVGLEYSITYKYVPSFTEEYCFVEAWRKEKEDI